MICYSNIYIYFYLFILEYILLEYLFRILFLTVAKFVSNLIHFTCSKQSTQFFVLI